MPTSIIPDNEAFLDRVNATGYFPTGEAALDEVVRARRLWRTLVAERNVLGKPAHDDRLVAAMIRHGVTHLLTFNAADFARFAEVTAVAPANAAALPPASP
jgi:predicted nucleic acid-binding protein